MKDEKQQLMQAYKKKNGDVSKRLQMRIYAKVYWMTPSGAAATMHLSRSWDGKLDRRYEERGIDGLQDKPRSGRPPAVYRGMMKRVRRMARKTRMWTAEKMSGFIFEKTGHRYDISYVRKIMKKWGHVMKVPVLMHARRPDNRRIRRFREKAKDATGRMESKGCLTCIQDETIAIAGAWARKEVYTLKNERAVYTYAGDHAKTIVFGIITNDGEGCFERYKFTKDEFVSFLKNACQKFGKLLMILNRAPQHKAVVVRDAPGELSGQMKLLFLPAGCPDLSAIGEMWRQTEMAVLVGPYVKFKKMCSNIDEWPDKRLPSPDIYRHVYRSI